MSDFGVRLDTAAFAGMRRALSNAPDKAKTGIARGVNKVGAKANTQVIRALVPQTQLPRKVIAKAVRQKKATAASLEHRLSSRGGNIRLKFFKAKETRSGVVSKSPVDNQSVPGGFIRGGGWPNRKALRFGGHVFRRSGSKRLPIKVVRSGVYIPDQMIHDASLDAWEQQTRGLGAQVLKELASILR